jgi:hypothetical protein
MFDAVQVKFNINTPIKSPFANTRVVPFIDSYFEILKAVVDDVKTEYFWFFSNFVNLKDIDLEFRPEQHEREQIHVWHTDCNNEGNVMLIPTQKFKEQMHEIDFLRDYKDINYHKQPTIWHVPIGKQYFKLEDPLVSYTQNIDFYTWLVNDNLSNESVPNFYPSFWEDEKMYTWGQTKDILLIPGGRNLKQFYDIERHVHFDFDYKIRPMDIIFLSYDEPNAEDHWKILKERYPRAKRCHGIKGRTKAYHTAAKLSDTSYFFAVFPTIELNDKFDFTFQPDRLREPCHYIFNCKNPVNGLEYGHRAVILYNKKLCLETQRPKLDFTLSKAHTVVRQLCGITRFNKTPEISWRVAFREVLKLCEMTPTVESQYRLKKWCELGVGEYASYVQKGALDAVEYYKEVKGDKDALQLSYELEWLKKRFNFIS